MQKFIKTFIVDNEAIDVFLGASIILEALKIGVDLVKPQSKEEAEVVMDAIKLGALAIKLGNESKYSSFEDVLERYPSHTLIRVALKVQETFNIENRGEAEEKK